MIKKILRYFGYAVFTEAEIMNIIRQGAMKDVTLTVIDRDDEFKEFRVHLTTMKPKYGFIRTYTKGTIPEILIKDALTDFGYHLVPTQ